MKSIKNYYFDLIGLNEKNETGFAFNLEGRSYSKDFLFLDSTTYEGKIYKLNLKTGIVEVNKIEDWSKKAIKNMQFEYTFIVSSENLKRINDFLSKIKAVA